MIMTNNVFIKSKPYEYRAHPFCLMILYQIIFFKITFCHVLVLSDSASSLSEGIRRTFLRPSESSTVVLVSRSQLE